MAGSWMLCYLWLLDVLVGHSRGHSLFSCEPIILRMCQDLPYNTTFMPNLLNHYDQQTAALAMEAFLSLLQIFIFEIAIILKAWTRSSTSLKKMKTAYTCGKLLIEIPEAVLLPGDWETSESAIRAC